MNVEFRASFAKDLKNISKKDVLKRVREMIELDSQPSGYFGPQEAQGRQ